MKRGLKPFGCRDLLYHVDRDPVREWRLMVADLYSSDSEADNGYAYEEYEDGWGERSGTEHGYGTDSSDGVNDDEDQQGDDRDDDGGRAADEGRQDGSSNDGSWTADDGYQNYNGDGWLGLFWDLEHASDGFVGGSVVSPASLMAPFNFIPKFDRSVDSELPDVEYVVAECVEEVAPVPDIRAGNLCFEDASTIEFRLFVAVVNGDVGEVCQMRRVIMEKSHGAFRTADKVEGAPIEEKFGNVLVGILRNPQEAFGSTFEFGIVRQDEVCRVPRVGLQFYHVVCRDGSIFLPAVRNRAGFQIELTFTRWDASNVDSAARKNITPNLLSKMTGLHSVGGVEKDYKVVRTSMVYRVLTRKGKLWVDVGRRGVKAEGYCGRV
ncbi:hypothetical protein K402DRAFT_399635 [Aulographum hederae CBS 113979]|uniref:Uncharacterized protein n=1 Tax=Aulographum hederae CBS 113979 TaxID=1176131 RepID=A0A6G1HHN4_9PEZI|nr:hypothetical protein K402DRAFT_399635 [Aulographum hederae CBS 113979]